MEAGFTFIPASSAEAQQDRLEHRRGFQRRLAARRSQGARGHQAAAQGPPGGLGSGGAERSVARAVRSSVEWRHAGDRGQPRVPGQFHGRVRGLSRHQRPASSGRAPTQAGVLAAPMSYEIEGEQYVAIEVGWGGAFGLAAGELARDAHLAVEHSASAGLQARRRPRNCPSLPAAAPRQARSAAGNRRRGHLDRGQGGVSHLLQRLPRRFGGERRRHARTCGCRWSPAIRRPGRSIVRGGERTPRGMVSFAAEVSPEDSEKVRAYVIHRAHEDPESRSCGRDRSAGHGRAGHESQVKEHDPR